MPLGALLGKAEQVASIALQVGGQEHLGDAQLVATHFGAHRPTRRPALRATVRVVFEAVPEVVDGLGELGDVERVGGQRLVGRGRQRQGEQLGTSAGTTRATSTSGSPGTATWRMKQVRAAGRGAGETLVAPPVRDRRMVAGEEHVRHRASPSSLV